MVLSIGTVLSRAKDYRQHVKVLVQGHWLSGEVLGVDGYGVLLDSGEAQSMVRLEAVSAVQLLQQKPGQAASPAAPHTLTVAAS